MPGPAAREARPGSNPALDQSSAAADAEFRFRGGWFGAKVSVHKYNRDCEAPNPNRYGRVFIVDLRLSGFR